MTHIDMNKKIVDAFGVPMQLKEGTFLQSMSIHLSGETYPQIDVTYFNTKNIIDDALEEIKKSFELQEIIYPEIDNDTEK